MRWELIASAFAITGVAARADRLASIHNARNAKLSGQDRPLAHRGVASDKWTRDGPVEKKFENANTTRERAQVSAVAG